MARRADNSGELPSGARLFTDAHRERTLVFRGQPIEAALRELGARGVVTVLIEGGGSVLAQTFAAQLVDEVCIYVAPLLCGTGRALIDPAHFSAGSIALRDVKVKKLGDDVRISGFPVRLPAWRSHLTALTLMKPAFIFDRDGTVNVSPGPGYVLRWEDFQFMPGISDMLGAVIERGFTPVLITNQQCVGKGLLTRAGLDLIHARMQAALGPLAFADILVCPHLDGTCTCRKPSPEFVFEAAARHGLDLASSRTRATASATSRWDAAPESARYSVRRRGVPGLGRRSSGSGGGIERNRSVGVPAMSGTLAMSGRA